MTLRMLILAAVYLCFGCADKVESTAALDVGSFDMAQGQDASNDQFTAPTTEDMGVAAPRVAYITVGHRFSSEIGVPGQGLSTFSLSEGGVLSAERIRFQAEHSIAALDYLGQSGTFVVASEDGHYSHYDSNTQPPTRLYTNQIDVAGVVSVSGGYAQSIAIVSRDSSATGGVYWFDLNEGLDVPTFVKMPLAYAAAQCVGDGRWVVIGGQTTFEPVFDADVHIFDVSADTVEPVVRGDITREIYDLRSVALTSDCRYAVFGNQSLFSETFGRLFLVDLSTGVPLLADSVDTDEDISQVTYVAALDLFLVSSFESEQMSTYAIENGRLVRRAMVARQGLIAGVAVLPKDVGTHLVIASIHASQGSRIGTCEIDVNGEFGEVDWRPLGEGGENIPSMLTHSGWVRAVDGE